MKSILLLIILFLGGGCSATEKFHEFPLSAYPGTPTEQFLHKTIDDINRMYPPDGGAYGLNYNGWGVGLCELVSTLAVQRLINARNQGIIDGEINRLWFITNIGVGDKKVGHIVTQFKNDEYDLCIDNAFSSGGGYIAQKVGGFNRAIPCDRVIEYFGFIYAMEVY